MGWKATVKPTSERLGKCYVAGLQKAGWQYWQRTQGTKVIRNKVGTDRWEAYVPLVNVGKTD